MTESIAIYESDQRYSEILFEEKIHKRIKGLSFEEFCSLTTSNKFLYLYSYKFTKFSLDEIGYEAYLLFFKNREIFLSKWKTLYTKWLTVL